MSITRRNYGSGHGYTIDGEKVPGVTTVIREALPTPALIEWAGNTTAAYAVDFWDELGALTPSKRLKRLNGARYEERDAAARRGTEVHRLAEALVRGLEVAVPDELAGHVEAYVDFLNHADPKAILVEGVIGNRSVRYCGTVDLVAAMFGQNWLLDLKTSRSGIFGETALQCCAYARAEVYLEDGEERPMAELGIERVGALHVRADGWDLRELEWGEDVWTFFRHLAWIQRRIEAPRSWVGPSMEC